MKVGGFVNHMGDKAIWKAPQEVEETLMPSDTLRTLRNFVTAKMRMSIRE